MFPREPLSLSPLYFRDLVHVQGFSFTLWSWPPCISIHLLSKTFVFSFLLACPVDWVLVCNIQLMVCNIHRLRALVRCVISDLLPRSIKEPFRSLLCHHSIHIESFDSFLQGLSHLFQRIILGSHYPCWRLGWEFIEANWFSKALILLLSSL